MSRYKEGCGGHAFRTQSVCTKTLPMTKERMGLRDLVLGTSFVERGTEEDAASALNNHLLALIELLPKVYGDNDPCRQAVLEIGTVVDMPATQECIVCKRAMLLYAIATEGEASNYWSKSKDGSEELARDLRDRVLPFITPRFLKHCCQAPDHYVRLSLLLTEMWRGENLGNFLAHRDTAIR